jgi:hypothetical protein
VLKNILKITVRAKIFTIAKRYFRAKFKALQSIGKYGQVERGVGATKSYPAFLIDLYNGAGQKICERGQI